MEEARQRAAVAESSVWSMVALLVLVLVAYVELGDAAAVVDVYRLIQYDLAGAPYGSRLAGLNHHAGVPPFAAGADVSRTVVILPVRDLNLSILADYVTKPLGGLLLLLPQQLGVGADTKNIGDVSLLRSKLADLEQLLIHASIPFPVYFAFEDDKIDTILADVQKGDISGQPASATTGGYKLVLSASDPKKIASPTITNIQGWLPGLKGEGETNQLPTIAVVASYDTFGAAPELSVGSDSNGSGVVALLEIARLFSRLYSNPTTRGRFNLLFGLTSGGPYNYNGALKWLRSFDQRMRESIDYAISLNSIGASNDQLWMHVSKPPENAYIKGLFQGISQVAKGMGITVGVKHKKINISDPRVAWEHEQFSKLRMTAVTLSELPAAPKFLESTGGLYDSRNFVNEVSIVRTVKIVAESLAKHIYGHEGKNIEIFADGSSLAVNPSYISTWLDLLSRTPRVAPFLSKSDPFITALKKELSDHTAEVHLQHETLDGIFTFYDSTKAKLNIYQVASVTFDLLLLLMLGCYLLLLFSFLVITTRGLDDLVNIFRRPPSRKVKST